MKQLLLGVFLSLFWLNANNAQEFYHLFEPFESYLYQDDEGFMHTVRWDSVYIGDATDYFFNYRTFRQEDNGYFTDQGISWMGFGIRRFYGSNHNYVMLKDDEEMAIKIGGNLGEEFPMYEYSNGDIIWGTISSVEEEAFLGVTDSIKTIEIRKKNMNGDEIPYFYNGFLIKVSKSHGMVRGFNFGEFPDGQMEVYTLVGEKNAGLGVWNMTFKETFSMVPGDEIHVHSHANTFQNGFDGKYIYDVLEKTFNSDETEVSITFKRCAYEFEVENEQETERSFDDTIQLTYYDYLPLQEICFSFPGELPDIPFGEDPRSYSRQTILQTVAGRRVKSFGELYNPFDDLYNQYIDYECGYHYIEGLGQFYYFVGPGGESYSEPVYFKQGNEVWGTPYLCNDLLAVDDLASERIKVSPNPFSNEFSIEMPFSTARISIYNVAGKKVLEDLIVQNGENIDVSQIQKGAYFYILTNKQQHFSGKLIKLE